MSVPFLIYGLPRSRTAWLSAFLSYKEFQCFHEIAICMRSVEDVRNFFARPNVGSCETAVAQGRQLVKHIVPNIKEVVVLRPVEEVVSSVMNMDVSGVATYDEKLLRRNMNYGDRVLRKIANDPSVLMVNYHDLNQEKTCRTIFEHCLPYPFDKSWWEAIKDDNIQANVKGVLEYYHKNRDAIECFKSACKSELRKLFLANVLAKKVRN